MNVAAARQIVDFLTLSEKLKCELRHSWQSDGQQENVAAHTWHMALMALLSHPHLENKVDIAHTLKVIIVHDLVEAIAGDVPYTEQGERRRLKKQREEAAMEEIVRRLPEASGSEVRQLWYEFEERQTPEAKFAGALDHLEVQAQHNLAQFNTWEPAEFDLVYTKMDDRCEHDSFLIALKDCIRTDAEHFMRKGGVNPADVKARSMASS